MPITPTQVQQAIAEVNASLQLGKISRADLICQSVLAQGIRPLDILFNEARVAAAVGELVTARRYLQEIQSVKPGEPAVTAALAELVEIERQKPVPAGGERFHLIKAWGNGFTADLDHTLGHLLLAEITGRTPVIHWGRNSLFRDVGVENAWPEFFEPVNAYSVADLRQISNTYFPSKWTAENLDHENLNKMTGPQSRVAGILFLNQPATVTVADFFTGVIELLPWVRGPHPLAVEGPVRPPEIEMGYRYLINKYLRPRAEILAAVDSFAHEHFKDRQILAVHVRGSDKAKEMADLPDSQQKIFAEVQNQLAKSPRLFVFLLTDEVLIRDQYMSAFPGRVITTDCIRSSNTKGIHYQSAPTRRQLGVEILTDIYLAARCHSLCGIGFTNVSNVIVHLKEWPEGSVKLVGYPIHYHRNMMLHA